MTQLTQEYFDEKVASLASRADLKDLATKDDLVPINKKLDAIMASAATRDEVRNLVRQLKTHGIELDEKKIFLT